MESFVSKLLETADLTVLTKKLVRVKYKEHIGRDLSTDEKETINSIVYKFISESAAKQRSSESSSPGTDKSLSPGDKENRDGARPRQIILKGQVVNKKDLKKVNRQPRQPEKRAKRKVYEPVKTYPKRKRTPRLEFADVMTAVLDSDNMVSSDQDDSQDTDRSNHGDEADAKSEESDIEPSEDVKKAVRKLKQERDKKIQMSQEKKQKFAKGTSVKETARRSLYGGSRVSTLKQEEPGYASNSSVILISDDSDIPPIQATQNKNVKHSCDKTSESTNIPKNVKKSEVKSGKTDSGSLTVSCESSPNKKRKFSKFRNLDGSSSDSNSSHVAVNKTPETYASKKQKFAKFRNLDGSSSDSDSNNVTVNKTPETYARKRKKKLLSREHRNSSANLQSKTKPQTSVYDIDSDSDSEMDVPLAKRRKISKQSSVEASAANGMPGTREDAESDCDLPDIDGHDNGNPPGDVSDSDLSTGDTPLARKQLALHSEGRKHNTADTGFESDSSTGDTPLANKFDNKRETRVKADTDRQVTSHRSCTSDSKISSARKEIFTIDTVSELSTGETPLARKSKTFAGKFKKTVTADADSDVSTGDTPLARKAQATGKTKKPVTANIDSDTESSTGDTPLARKSKTFRRKQKKIESDLSLSTGDTPLARKGFKVQPREFITILTEDTDSDADLSTGDTPLARKSEAKLRKSKKQVTAETDSELSTGDTPLARKCRTKSRTSKEPASVVTDSEGELSTGDTPLARKSKTLIHKQKKIESDSELSTGDTPLARKSKAWSGKATKNVAMHTDSELSTGDTPLARKSRTLLEKYNKIESDSELSTDDTSLARKCRVKSRKSKEPATVDTNSEAELSTGDTPLARKSRAFGEKSMNKFESDSKLSTGYTHLARKSKAKSGKSEDPVVIVTDSESQLSTGDTPLAVKSKAFIRKPKTAESDSELSTGDTPLARKSKAKPGKYTKTVAVDTDSELSKGDTPLARKSRTLDDKYKKIESDSELSTDDTPLARKSQEKSGKSEDPVTIETDSESQLSTGNTPLAVKSKTFIGKNKTIESDSELSTSDTPLARKSKGYPREAKRTAIKNKDYDVEFSKCDTPVSKNRKTSYNSTDLIQNSKSLTGKNKPGQIIAVTSGSDLSAEETSLADNVCSDDGDVVTDSDDRFVHSDGNSDSSTNYVPLGGKKKLGDSETDGDSDKCLDKSPFANRQRCTSDSEQSNDDTCTPVKKTKSQKQGRKKRLVEISDDETPKKKKPQKAKVGRLTATKLNGVGKHASDTDSDDSEDLPLSKLNKSSESHRKAPESSDSDEDQPLSKVKSKVKQAQQEKKISKKSNVEEESKHLKQLRKICRACGMFIRNDRELKGCSTDKQKVARLKEHLQQAGMKGQPSMKKAEEIRLQKEAAQLNESNIISEEPSRGKRKVKSMYSRRVASPKKAASPKKQMKNIFQSLQGIVDSEGSDEG